MSNKRAREAAPTHLQPDSNPHQHLYQLNRTKEIRSFDIKDEHYRERLLAWKAPLKDSIIARLGMVSFSVHQQYGSAVHTCQLDVWGLRALRALEKGMVWDCQLQQPCEISTRQRWEDTLRQDIIPEPQIEYLRRISQDPLYSDFHGKLTLWLMTATPKVNNAGRKTWERIEAE